MNLKSRIETACKLVSERLRFQADTGIICGSGLGSLAEEIENQIIISYEDIPGFPVSSVKGHKSRIIAGQIGKGKVLAFQGRFHYYEGYSLEDVTLPVRLMAALGVKNLIVTNAAGGLNRNYEVGDLMLIEDHINMMFQNPLIGPNDESMGPRFPDMSEPYSQASLKTLQKLALEHGTRIHKGVYMAVTGPSYETRAELRLFSRFADAVGMSTVPEVIAARHAQIPNIIGISCITNKATGEDIHKEDHDNVVKTANEATPRMVRLVREFLSR